MAAALLVPVPILAQDDAPGRPDPVVLFLVRHAETVDDGTRNPPLSDRGLRRARRLAMILADAEPEGVYTTDYQRTRATAAAVGDNVGMEAEVYDPRSLAGFAATLRARGGRALVVGHTNTTPALVEILGGDPGPPIGHDEFDRLYILFLHEDGVETLLLRY